MGEGTCIFSMVCNKDHNISDFFFFRGGGLKRFVVVVVVVICNDRIAYQPPPRHK